MTLLERLRDKYPDDALRRLVASNRDYQDTHGDYLPELAQLLLFEREERRLSMRPNTQPGEERP